MDAPELESTEASAAQRGKRTPFGENERLHTLDLERRSLGRVLGGSSPTATGDTADLQPISWGQFLRRRNRTLGSG